MSLQNGGFGGGKGKLLTQSRTMPMRMPKSLPFTPADVLQVGMRARRPVIRGVVNLAERFGFWKRPRARGATATEEMGALDHLNWIYKSRNPLEEYEQAFGDMRITPGAPKQIELPGGFDMMTRLRIGAAGDILRSPGIEASQDRSYERIEDLLFSRDIAYANFESPVTDQPLVEEVIGDAGPPLECCSRAQFEVLSGHKGRRFDVLNTANNHAFDMGVEGVETTREVMAAAGILAVGTNDTPDEHGRARFIEARGIKVGLVSDGFGLNGHELPEAERWRINVSKLLSKRAPPDLSLLKRQIDHCRAEGCDFILASIHWGHEFEFFPRKVQVDTARDLVEYGADSILCHHPHVVQPWEVYRTKRDPNRQAVIAYSLGSLTWGFMAPHIVLSAIMNMRLEKGRIGSETKTYVAAARVTPVVRTYRRERGEMVTRIEKLSELEPGRGMREGYLERIRAHAALVFGEDQL